MDADRPVTGMFDRDRVHSSGVRRGVAAARTVHLRASAASAADLRKTLLALPGAARAGERCYALRTTLAQMRMHPSKTKPTKLVASLSYRVAIRRCSLRCPMKHSIRDRSA